MTPAALFRLRIAGPMAPPQVVDLLPGRTTIGREADSEVVLRHDLVSRRHAVIDCTPAGECLITDQKSTNGTLVGGARLAANDPTRLKVGVKIDIGPFALTLEQAPIATPAGPPVAVPIAEAPSAPEPELTGQQPPVPASGPPPPPSPPPAAAGPDGREGEGEIGLLPGLTLHSQRLLQYLPDIYQPPRDVEDGDAPCFSDADFSPARFLSRFLALFESILLPIDWTVDNFDLFLSPGTAPAGFLPWLANWFGVVFDGTWTEPQQRALLAEAHQIYARRGTRWALSRTLELYLGQPPVIVDDAKDLKPFTFEVIVPVRDDPARRASIEAIVDAHKPAHTLYTLKFSA